MNHNLRVSRFGGILSISQETGVSLFRVHLVGVVYRETNMKTTFWHMPHECDVLTGPMYPFTIHGERLWGPTRRPFGCPEAEDVTFWVGPPLRTLTSLDASVSDLPLIQSRLGGIQSNTKATNPNSLPPMLIVLQFREKLLGGSVMFQAKMLGERLN